MSKKFLYFWGVQNTLKPEHMAKSAMYSLLALSLGLGVSACGDTKTAGGGPSGTEAGNAITAQILTAGITPAAMAKVRLMDSESLDGENSYEAKADENGVVTIEGIANGNYTLEAKLNGEALQLPVNVTGEHIDLGSDTLKMTATVSGNVGNTSANGTIKVRGLEHSTKVVDGDFTLDSLPEGALSLVFIPDVKDHDTSSTYLKVVAGKKTTSSTFAEERRSLLLDDFQDSNYQNRFMPAYTYDGGWWYFAYSTENVKADFIIGENHLFTLDNEDGNISAHVAAHFGKAYEDSTGESITPWAMIGIELGKSDKTYCYDISSVDSVAFRVKGIGAIRFNVIEAKSGSKPQKISDSDFTLEEDWTRVSVPLQGSKDALKCVNQLAWDLLGKKIDDYVEVWLDDIELIGGDRLSIWER